MHAIAIFALVYLASIVGRRLEDVIASTEELTRRAQGSRREFVMLDWDPRSP